MLDKMTLAVFVAYWKVRNKVDELKNNEVYLWHIGKCETRLTS